MYHVIAKSAGVVLVDRVVSMSELATVLAEVRARCLHPEVTRV